MEKLLVDEVRPLVQDALCGTCVGSTLHYRYRPSPDNSSEVASRVTAAQEVPIGPLVPKNLRPIDLPPHYVVQYARGIHSG